MLCNQFWALLFINASCQWSRPETSMATLEPQESVCVCAGTSEDIPLTSVLHVKQTTIIIIVKIYFYDEASQISHIGGSSSLATAAAAVAAANTSYLSCSSLCCLVVISALLGC